MTATITATVEATQTPPRVRLNVTTDQPSVTLFCVLPDGTRLPVRTSQGDSRTVSGGATQVTHNEVPLGVPVYYTASGSGVTNSATVTVNSGSVWLTLPGVPALARAVKAVKMEARSRAANSAVRYPIGAKYPITASDGRRKAPVYELVLRTSTLAELTGIEALCDDLSTLLLNVPANRGWGVGAEYVDVGTLVEDRLLAWGAHPYRQWRLPCTVVARPGGPLQVTNTFARSKALYPTFAARKAAHATFGQARDAV